MTYDEKVARLRVLIKSRPDVRGWAMPPSHFMLWKLGWEIPPPWFQRVIPLFIMEVVWSALFFVVVFLCLDLIFAGKSSPSIGVLIIMSLFAAGAITWSYLTNRKRLRLPDWEEFTGSEIPRMREPV